MSDPRLHQRVTGRRHFPRPLPVTFSARPHARGALAVTILPRRGGCCPLAGAPVPVSGPVCPPRSRPGQRGDEGRRVPFSLWARLPVRAAGVPVGALGAPAATEGMP
jgi:hypothetical protein